MPIADQVIKDFSGKIVNFVELPRFTFGKELQQHVLELKANSPFRSPSLFEETMQNGVETLLGSIEKNHHARLLGTGMHPLLSLEETRVWSHRHRKIYQEYDRLFNLKQHGWLNIQSFHLNIPYAKESEGVLLHNLAAGLCAYLPAISASSPFYEGRISPNVDSRLFFYKNNQVQIPSISGDVVPQTVSSFDQYRREIIDQYSHDLLRAGAGTALLFKEWVNSRGVILRFDRRAIEIRVMDEQECIKTDVALSCFIRATLRGLIATEGEPLPHDLLVKDFEAIIANGLDAKVAHPKGRTAREVFLHLLHLAMENASEDEKKYLWIIEKRIKNGNLSELIRQRILKKTQKTDLTAAIISVYSTLTKCLADNQPYF